MDFEKRYQKLNAAQKEAVDKIDGPLMVIAGPGTGKTELLSMRVANILKKTDTLPENILCLTFTDSGAQSMRDRLTDIIGKEAYKVAVHTFHSFGSEIINQNNEVFYNDSNFRPVDELSRHEILTNIFNKLDHLSPISAKNFHGAYAYQGKVMRAISELKKSGLTKAELDAILDENDIVFGHFEKYLSNLFLPSVNKTIIPKLISVLPDLKTCDDKIIIPTFAKLSEVIINSLESALIQADQTGKTSPITAWKNLWLEKNKSGNWVFKSRKRQATLRAVSLVYDEYLNDMNRAGFYDFDDMILNVAHAMEVNDELRFNLQEKYQFIMVDEFQDTNMAQMRIIYSLTDNDANYDQPNIMVVGDDDQAIYGFQGAEIGNIISFYKHYPRAHQVTLIENYRSSAQILNGSRDIIIQATNRLEDAYDNIDKNLKANQNYSHDHVSISESGDIATERHWLVSRIQQQINAGLKPCDIAILTRKHDEIQALLPYFSRAGISVNYEKRDNVLDLEPIVALEKLARLLVNIASGNHQSANSLIPEVLAYEAWNYEPIDIWKLSLKSYNDRMTWLEVMSTIPTFSKLHGWLIAQAMASIHQPLERMLDILIGRSDEASDYESPLFDYYFSTNKMNEDAETYLEYLEALRVIRTKLREYQPNKQLKLADFVRYVDLCHETGSVIQSNRLSSLSEASINIMTVHKSKGQEFDSVFIVNAVDNVWGEKARANNEKIYYPENLPLSPAGDTIDERLRLFYVAATRAKRQLFISYSLKNDNQKDTRQASFLVDSQWPRQTIDTPDNQSELIEAVENAWYQKYVSPTTRDMADLLRPTLDKYKLSVTHLHSFLDITRGGPSAFLLNNLLKFPQSKSASSAYGTAIHSTLQKIHNHFAATGHHQPIEDIVADFEQLLRLERLDDTDIDHYVKKGGDSLRAFLNVKYDSFTTSQKAELNFAGQNSLINQAHLTGKLDLVEINRDNHQIVVTDYKTGRALDNWKTSLDYDKLKSHKYRQQLMFYKLLIENSRDWHDYSVEKGIIQFVEPTKDGDILCLENQISLEDLDNFSRLITAVWDHIVNLNLPDTSHYELSIEGVIEFENDLISGNV